MRRTQGGAGAQKVQVTDPQTADPGFKSQQNLSESQHILSSTQLCSISASSGPVRTTSHLEDTVFKASRFFQQIKVNKCLFSTEVNKCPVESRRVLSSPVESCQIPLSPVESCQVLWSPVESCEVLSSPIESR